jgi:hypothetical protein
MNGERKRCVFTSGLKNRFAFHDYQDGVYCIIGPFANFTTDPDFQKELENLCRRFNLTHGHLSQQRYDELTGAAGPAALP